MSPAVAATYDAEADAAYLHLADAIDDGLPTSTATVELPHGGPVLLELDGAGRLLGVEVLHASRTLPAPLVARLTADPTP